MEDGHIYSNEIENVEEENEAAGNKSDIVNDSKNALSGIENDRSLTGV